MYYNCNHGANILNLVYFELVVPNVENIFELGNF
jgi:hypothetical protein